MKVFFNQIMKNISIETQSIDMVGCDISIEDAFKMVQFLQKCLNDLKDHFLSLKDINEQEETLFFKVMRSKLKEL